MKKIILIIFLLISLIGYTQAGDCPGQCVVSGGTYTAANGSIDTELSGVGGCLIAGEATSSYWFQVCFTSSGQFFMAINPSGNRNDFDFAVWNTSNCPPTTSPIRCSWAAVPIGPTASDITGLGNGATDNSEGATGNQWVAPINVSNNQCLTIGINNYGNGSNDFTINFTGTTATLYCPIGLPIELLSFSVENDDGLNYINWVTASETDNDYYNVEHSIDGTVWNAFIKVDGAGTDVSGNMYEVIHKDYTNNNNYYRLKQTDFNGNFTYSNPIVINNKIKGKEIYKIINVLGNEVEENTQGIKIIIYSDGTTQKYF